MLKDACDKETCDYYVHSIRFVGDDSNPKYKFIAHGEQTSLSYIIDGVPLPNDPDAIGYMF